MRTILGLLAPLLVAAAPASAALYSTSFSGTVTSQIGTTFAVGSTINGSFVYSSDVNRFLSFSIGGFSTTAPATSIATTSPALVINPYEAVYRALTSSVQTGGSSTVSFALDLLSLTNFTSNNALALLTNPGPLETQTNSFDGNYSAFTYYNGPTNAVTQRITAGLNPASLSTAVPEPASLVLLGAPLLSLLLRRRA